MSSEQLEDGVGSALDPTADAGTSPTAEDGGGPSSFTPSGEPQYETQSFSIVEGSTGAGLNTFRGVFRPTILTIIGVMLYLRLGWVVGEVGLFGALAIIVVMYAITIPTALALSSITTNVRLGSGGVFGLIAQSLGLETGGAIGIPLYIAQALSAGLYLYGFTETWLHIFPSHHPQVVLGAAFVAISVTVSFVRKYAFAIQAVVLVIGIASLTSILLGAPYFETSKIEVANNPQWWGDGDFWKVFAVFFPAGTGVMVGAGMAGDLKNPRRSIPSGTMAAVLVSLVVYVVVAIWYGIVATPEELLTNNLIIAERAAVSQIVLLGVLASTFTAALSSMITAPLLLQSLGAHNVLPRADFFASSLRNASLATVLLVAGVLTLGSLDRVAALITMFFLLTYLIVNFVVFIEQALGMVSFRPTFKVPIWIPIFGGLGSALASFIVNPAFAMVAIAVVVSIYVWLSRRELETPWETVRSSIFVSVVDWALRRVDVNPDENNERSWKPDLLVPVSSKAQLDGSYRFLRSLALPKGTLQIVGVADNERTSDFHLLPQVTREFREDGLYSTAAVLESPNLVHGVRQCCSVLAGSQFRPNVLYALVHDHDEETLQGLVDASVDHRIGAAFLKLHPESGFGRERSINVWVRDQSPNWALGLHQTNLDLAILFAYQLSRNWGASIQLVCVVRDEGHQEMAEKYLDQLMEEARLPATICTRHVIVGEFLKALHQAPDADLQIVGLPPKIDASLTNQLTSTGSSVLYVRDSGRESALA